MDAQEVDPGLALPEFLQLAGHPLRWPLLGELARSDRTVHELTGLVGEPQNLVSYHLGKLRDGGLVSARRSSADRRDAYYTVDLTRSVACCRRRRGAPSRPSSRPSATRRRRAGRGEGPVPVHRQQRAFADGRGAGQGSSGGAIEAHSAGSHPKPLHPNAVRVMRDEHGLDLAAQASKHLDVFDDEHFDWVISLCDRVREVCPEFPGDPETIHWSIANPAAGEPDDDATYPLFQHTAAELATRIGFLLAVLTDRTPPL